MEKLKSICVFCGSSPGGKPYFSEAAWELGILLAEKKITLVFGGGHVGLMGVVADSVMKHGGKAIGVIPGFLEQKELAHKGVTEMIVVESMHQRKQKMADLSDGFIALPGGLGTLEELAEILTWSQLGLHKKPLGLLNVKNYYSPLLDMFKSMTKNKFMREENLGLFVKAKTPKTLIEKMKLWEGTAEPKWIVKSKT